MEARTGTRTAEIGDERRASFRRLRRRKRALELESAPVERSWWAVACKRGFDIFAASLALIVLSPFLALIAILIKLDSRGPLLFTQERIGRHAHAFGMLKFRTMVDGADDHKHTVLHLNEREGGLFKITGDPRVTRFGGFLRSTSLDELPQLINVLRGEMSIVGPRPLIGEEDQLITGALRRRLEMRPGMTGAWQASGASSIPLGDMAAMDYEYVEQQSFIGDLGLIIRTIPHVVMRRGI